MNKSLFFNVVLVLLVWLSWYFYTMPASLLIIRENWPVTLTMVFGSFIAGATSEGGGAIAFPVFTKVLQVSPMDAKVFSLAIQSVGMVAATFTIVVMRIKVEWRIIKWASLGGLFGIFLSSLLIAPMLPASLLKMLFTTMIVSFAFTLTFLNWKKRLYNTNLLLFGRSEKLIVVWAGFFGGMMTGLVGTGIDIICFSVMVLLFRLTEKLATPTSVILMAVNSVFGFVLHLYVIDGFTTMVAQYWLAAIPVVVVGAPLGAYLCSHLNNQTIATVLIVLICIELVSSLYLIPLSSRIISICSVAFFLFSFFYFRMSISKRYVSNLEED